MKTLKTALLGLLLALASTGAWSATVSTMQVLGPSFSDDGTQLSFDEGFVANNATNEFAGFAGQAVIFNNPFDKSGSASDTLFFTLDGGSTFTFIGGYSVTSLSSSNNGVTVTTYIISGTGVFDPPTSSGSTAVLTANRIVISESASGSYSMTISSVVPIPAAGLLFGSALIGFAVLARRGTKKRTQEDDPVSLA